MHQALITCFIGAKMRYHVCHTYNNDKCSWADIKKYESTAMTDPQIFCVLTPPRSGSSLTTGVMNILGVYLGNTQNLAEPGIHNPKGYFEHEAMLGINKEILSRLGYDYWRWGAEWPDIPVFQKHWEQDPLLDDLRDAAKAIIDRDFQGYSVWGWKDPRSCFTLPFWQGILTTIQCIICIRNPVDVARSQQRYINCSFERGLYLWLLHLKYALQYSEGNNRMFIQTEAWTDDWKRELNRLARFIGNPQLAASKHILCDVQRLIDKNLWHHQTSSQALSIVLEKYEQLLGNTGLCVPGLDLSLQGALDKLVSEAIRSDVKEVESTRHRWRQQIELASHELGSLIPKGSCVILVDDNQIGPEVIKDRTVIPFLEKNGQYWGSPPDDSTAIKELKQLRDRGAAYIAFAWPAHWWLKHFPALNDHLRSMFHCVLQNERLVVFDLRDRLLPA